MDKKYLKWSLVLTWALMAFAFLVVVLYTLTPTLISMMMGVSIKGNCGVPAAVSHGNGKTLSNISAAILNLCSTAQQFLGITAMLLIVAGALPALAANLIASLEVLQSPMDNPRKAVWLVAFWLLFAFLAVTAYYLTDRKRIVQMQSPAR